MVQIKILLYILKLGFMFLLISVICFSGLTLLVINTSRAGKADVLVVLGAGLNGARVSTVLGNRLYAAKLYADNYPDSVIIVSGGQGRNELRSEASAMKEFLTDLGVSPERIIMEDKSTSTVENFVFSRRIIEEMFGTDYTCAFATNGFHCFRSKLIAEEAGLRGIGIVPAPTSPGNVPYNCFREYFALLWQLRYIVFTIGAAMAFAVRNKLGR